MTDNDEKLRRFLSENKPIPKEPLRTEGYAIWNAIERGNPNAFYRRAAGYLAPAVALLLVVFWVSRFTGQSNEEHLANASMLSESLSLSFLEEDEGLDEVDFVMASLRE